ncbi:hypothetical protein RclHR1_03950010 [Rhizophagus clarus]|uniref:F-box domain-containing protein n=1 Tax=Rhizophagus clarus TaxID=94130 RepID=A0A2Z6RF54_9GLOM|nr:hypothetical protein RclHR1_03950010 [Rhizophagus clarus]
MSQLDRDILYLIFKELHNDRKALHSCLLVNKTWCEIIIPILWGNPWKYLIYRKRKLLLDVIKIHLSDESRNKLEDDDSFNLYKKPLLNYVNFCKHLNLNIIRELVQDCGVWIVYNEIIHLFINENSKLSHLYIPQRFDYQIRLIPGVERCISKIEFLSCDTIIGDNILCGLIEMCKSIRELELFISMNYNNYRIAKLIESAEKLIDVRFLTNYGKVHDVSFCNVLENSLVKHANTIQHFKINKKPTTQILSHLINLKSLVLDGKHYTEKWDCLENLTLPYLQVLKVNINFPTTSLANMIENTSGYLTEITIDGVGYDDFDNERIIQAIYTKCPNLKYIKLEIINNNNIFELEKLLIKCQYLEGLFIIQSNSRHFSWITFFEMLTESSPTNLFKFKFKYISNDDHTALKLFFDNWESRCPNRPSMILQFLTPHSISVKNKNLIKKYKAKGIIKTFANHLSGEDFEWI